MVRIALAVAVVLLARAPGVRAEVRVHEAAHVSIDVPKDWKTEVDNDTMTITDPKEEVAFFLMILDAGDIQKALDAIDSEVSKSFKGVKWENEPKTHKLNGMDAIGLDGLATVDGKPVELGVLLVATPAKKVLMVLGAIEKDKTKQHEKTVEKFIASIKPAK
jgi:hypothetical protein